MQQETNPLLLHKTWNELVNFLRVWPGPPGEIAAFAKDPVVEKHIAKLLEEEISRLKEVVFAGSEVVFEEEKKRVSSFGITLPDTYLNCAM